MKAPTIAALAFVAGMSGGLVSQLIVNASVHAQEPLLPAKEIRAEKFVMVDESGKPRGAFAINPKDGWPILEMIDKKGRVWQARTTAEGFFGTRKPSVTPAK
jgi:hypothetical protein